MKRLLLAGLLLLFGLSAPSAQLSMMGVGPANSGTGGGTGADLLANTGQPIFSTGTTPILVQ